MSKFLDVLFFIVFFIYNKWKDSDAFYHSAFIVGVLFASTVSFLLEVLFLITRSTYFKIGYPLGSVIFFLIIVYFIYYYHRRKNILITFYTENKNQLNIGYMMYYIVLALMFSTWFVTPFLFKLGN